MKTISIHTRLSAKLLVQCHQVLSEKGLNPTSLSEMIRTATQFFVASNLGNNFWQEATDPNSEAAINNFLSNRADKFSISAYSTSVLVPPSTLSITPNTEDKISSSFSPEDAPKATRVLAFLKAGSTTINENLSSDNELLRNITVKLIELFPDLMSPQPQTSNPSAS